MKAPDKIYLERSLSFPDKFHNHWYKEDVVGNGEEYIRKEALMEWINEARAVPHENAIVRDLAFQEVVNKLNSM